MRYQINHTTKYSYNQSVFLKPHLLRLQPRSDAWQQRHNLHLQIEPQPAGISHFSDLDGNYTAKLWFTRETSILTVSVTSEVETLINNPFEYLAESWVTQLPLDYPVSLQGQIEPYLKYYQGFADPVAIKLAQEIVQQTQGQVIEFLSTLNQLIYNQTKYIHRERGEPLPPGITWNTQQGSCRDLTVLFMEVCRVVGIPSRFVSGYEAGDRSSTVRELHAWAEVYIPGAGWRGYDPTNGLLVCDRHVAVAASAIPSQTAPISGTFTPVEPIFVTQQVPTAQMETKITLDLV